nr:MFS transporter [Burkholderia metallica]
MRRLQSESAQDSAIDSEKHRRKVVIGATVGTVFEWYDFFLYISASSTISDNFFSNANPAAAIIFALLTFATGYLVRPFGALFFGRLGDLVGRKHTFPATILIMGGSTIAIGLLPTYASVGLFAPSLLVGLRNLQGLALGGEYGARPPTSRNTRRSNDVARALHGCKPRPSSASHCRCWSCC